MKKLLLGVFVLFFMAGCYSTSEITVKEFDLQGNVTKETTTKSKENIIETLAVQNKDKTFIIFRKMYMVGLEVTPASTSTESFLSLKCVYLDNNTGLASIVKDQQNMDKIADIVSVMKGTSTTAIGATGVTTSSGSK